MGTVKLGTDFRPFKENNLLALRYKTFHTRTYSHQHETSCIETHVNVMFHRVRKTHWLRSLAVILGKVCVKGIFLDINVKARSKFDV